MERSLAEEGQRKRSNIGKTLEQQQENKAIYTNIEAKGSCPSFLAHIYDRQVDISLPFFGPDMVRISTHFEVGFPQWNGG